LPDRTGGSIASAAYGALSEDFSDAGDEFEDDDRETAGQNHEFEYQSR
jgi:hypothetical protein